MTSCVFFYKNKTLDMYAVNDLLRLEQTRSKQIGCEYAFHSKGRTSNEQKILDTKYLNFRIKSIISVKSIKF